MGDEKYSSTYFLQPYKSQHSTNITTTKVHGRN